MGPYERSRDDEWSRRVIKLGKITWHVRPAVQFTALKNHVTGIINHNTNIHCHGEEINIPYGRHLKPGCFQSRSWICFGVRPCSSASTSFLSRFLLSAFIQKYRQMDVIRMVLLVARLRPYTEKISMLSCALYVKDIDLRFQYGS